MNRERYRENRIRVYEIYNIDPKDRNYDCHHIVFRRDVGEYVPPDFDVDQLSNLIPIKRSAEHEPLHKYVDDLKNKNNSKRKTKRKFHHNMAA